MTKRIIALLCVCTLMLSCSVYATSYNYGFTDYMADEWSNSSNADEAEAIAAGKIGVQTYAAEKMVYVAKTANSGSSPSATKTFDELSGNIEIWLTYSVSGEGESYIEFLNASDEVVLKFAASKDAFVDIDAEGTEKVIASGLEENARYTVKLTSAAFPYTGVTVQVGSGSDYASRHIQETISKVKVSAADYGNTISVYHFSASGDGSFCWDDIQEDDDLASWSFAARGNKVDVRETGEGGFLNYYRGETGHHAQVKWKVGDGDRALGFKMTMRYSLIGDSDVQPRLLRQDGQQYFTQLKLTPTGIQHATEQDTSKLTDDKMDVDPSQIHTLTMYSNYSAADTYDLYLDGQPLSQDIPQINEGDTGLGAIIFYSHITNKNKFAMRIYTLNIEDRYERKALNVSGGVFKDEYGNELTDIQAGTITGEYNISSDGLGEPEGMLMMMQYEGDKLVNISATPVTALVNEDKPVSAEIEISDVTDDTKLYMCLWDGLDTIVPMTETMNVLD